MGVKQHAPWHLTARGMAKRSKDKKKRILSQSYLAAICSEVNMNDIKAVARKVIEDAKDGDAKAREWLGKYILGNGRTDLRELGSPSILKRGV